MSDPSLTDQVGQAVAVAVVLAGVVTFYVVIAASLVGALWLGLRHKPAATLIGCVWAAGIGAAAWTAAHHPWVTGLIGAIALALLVGLPVVAVRRLRRNPRPQPPIPAEVAR